MKSKFFRILGVVASVAMIAGMLAVPVLATVNTVTLSVSVTTISALSNYTVQYTSAADLAEGGTITVTMPTGATNLSAVTAAISGTSGIGSDAFLSVAATVVITPAGSQNLVVTVPDINTQNKIGSAARVQIVFTGVRNPDSIGDFGVSVKTSTETTAVPSTTFTTTIPVIVTLPGIVKLYNASNILMYQNNAEGSITAAVALVTGKNFTIELGPGLYDEIVVAPPLTGAITIPAVAEGLTIKASGAKADTVVPVQWTVDAASVKFTGLTLKPCTTTGFVMDIHSNKVTVDGCDFARAGSALTVTAQAFIIYDNWIGDTGTGTITNCTFDATLGAGADYIIQVSHNGTLTISKNIFKMDATGTTSAAASDEALYIEDGDTNVTENTFTGTSNFGYAIDVTADNDEYIFINKNTFTGVEEALYYDGWSYCDFTNNTVDASGNYSATDVGLNDNPFWVDYTAGLSIVQNKITNSKYYIAYVDYDCNASMNFNELTGNSKGIFNDDNDCGFDATHNWWGAATGPAADYNTGDVDTSAYLGSVSSNGQVVYGEHTLIGKTTSGVDVQTFDWTGTPVDVDQMGSASYAAKPSSVALASTYKVVKYFDVFVDDNNYETIRMKFYGTVNDFSEVWYYDADNVTWVKCETQTVIVSGGYVLVTVHINDDQPGWQLMKGLPFVLAEAPPSAPAGTPVTQMPTLGAVNVPIDTTFTWPTVAGAVSYTFEIAEEIGQIDKFYLKDEVAGPTVNAYKLLDNLKYDTQYWWRVQAVNSLGVKSAWTVSFFTTAKEPVPEPEPLPPVIVEETPAPIITLEIPAAEKVDVIPPYLIWAVIAVGAILVIAVIVLIVRTRRIS